MSESMEHAGDDVVYGDAITVVSSAGEFEHNSPGPLVMSPEGSQANGAAGDDAARLVAASLAQSAIDEVETKPFHWSPFIDLYPDPYDDVYTDPYRDLPAEIPAPVPARTRNKQRISSRQVTSTSKGQARPRTLTIGAEASDFILFSPAPIRRRLRLLLVLALVLAVAGGAGLWVGIRNHAASTQSAHVLVNTQRTSILVSNGSIDLAGLRRSLTRSGHGNLISSVPGGAVEVNADIVVGKRGELSFVGAALLLRSDVGSQVRLSSQGGTLNFDDDTITSWTPQGTVDSYPVGGRSDIVAIGRGTKMNFTNSRVVALGYDTQDPGVSWRAGASGVVRDSQFSQNWRGAYAYQSGTITIVGSSFADSQEDGLLLLKPGAGSTVQNTSFDSNGQAGLEVAGTNGPLELAGDSASHNRVAGLLTRVSADVVVTGGLFYDNRTFGISANGGHLSLDGVKVWANQTGVFIDNGQDSIISSDLSANTLDGMYVTGATTGVSAASDDFDHNSRSGVWVTDGEVAVTAGTFDENLTGIRVDGFSHAFRADGNTISNSIKDGIALDVAPGIEIKGNEIENNGDSAISTDKAYNLRRVLKENTIANNNTATRIRAS